MQIFPTQYSLLSAAALNNYIQEHYGLRNTSCKLLIHNVSDTYLIENPTDKYILKVYRDAHRKVDEIKAEVELLLVLKDRGAKVSYPLNNLDGAQLQTFYAAEGTRYGVLFSFAEGKVIHDMTEPQLLTVGIEMAKIHQITSTIELQYPRKEYTIDTMLAGPLAKINPAFEDLTEEYEYLLATTEIVLGKISDFNLEKFSWGYCHYDFLPKNFHFDADGKITFFDFDFAGKGLLANDIVSFYIHFFLEIHFNKITQQKADDCFAVFVNGYRSIRPLTDEEIAAIPYLGFAFWIFYFGFHYENFEDWSNSFFGPRFIKERVALIKKWVDWYCKF